MHLSEQQYIILFSLVKFYTHPQEETLKRLYGDNIYSETYDYFKENLEYFVNKKIALDRIYNSLSNASQTYAIFRQSAYGNIGPLGAENESKVFMAFNESFISALIINFSKLREVLTFKKNIIINDETLCDDFTYLDDLNNRIINAKVTEIRNGWFAHAYDGKRDGIVYRDKDIKETILNILKDLCLDEHLEAFNISRDRLLFFCETYLFEARTTLNMDSIIADVVHNTNNTTANVSTKAKDIIREINTFSRKIRDIKLYGIENFFIVEDAELANWARSPEVYFKDQLSDLKKAFL